MSTTTISLPRPFILTKAWLASALMGGPLSAPYRGKLAGRGKLRCLAARAAHEAIINAERPFLDSFGPGRHKHAPHVGPGRRAFLRAHSAQARLDAGAFAFRTLG